MNIYRVNLTAYTEISVRAKSREEAESLALDKAGDLQDFEWCIDDVERRNPISADGRVLPECVCCGNCQHYVAEQKLCKYANVPNDKEPDWHCCLYDDKD